MSKLQEPLAVDPVPAGKPPLYTRNFGLIWLSTIFFAGGFQVILPVLPLYVIARGGTAANAGVVFAVATTAALPVRMVGGAIADRFGRKPLLLGGILANFIATFGYDLATTVAGIGLVRGLQGAGYGAMTNAGGALVADITPASRRGEGLGAYGLTVNASQLIAPAIGVLILSRYSFEGVFLAAAVSVAISLALALFVREPPVARPAAPTPLRTLLRPSNLFTRGALWPAFLIMFVVGALLSVNSYAPLFAAAFQIPSFEFFYSIIAIATVLSRIVAGRLTDRIGRTAVAIPATATTALSVAAIGLWPHPALFFVAAAALGFSVGAAQPALMAMAVDRSPPDRRAATSTVFFASDIGVTFFVAGLPQLLPMIGFQGLYVLTAILVASALIVFVVAIRREG